MPPDHNSAPTEISWEVDGEKIEGLAWGPQDGIPILALHGWLDHAESFQLLAPRLTGCRVIAIDLPGHGKSHHKSSHAPYYIWSDIPQIIGVLDQLGWRKCVLLGHSRGAIISALFSAVCPERVAGVVAIDSLMPQAVPSEQVVEQMRNWVDDHDKLNKREPRFFSNPADFVSRRARVSSSRTAAEKLAFRALEPTQNGLKLRSDTRLSAASPVKLNQRQIETILASIQAPILALWATEGAYRQQWLKDLDVRAAAVCSNYRSRQLKGDHHLHLQNHAVAELANEIENFLREVAHPPVASTPDQL